jgi:hypothetical protein
MSEKAFVSVHCFHKAVYKKLMASFKGIAVASGILLSHKAQNPLTVNDHHTMATFKITHTHS